MKATNLYYLERPPLVPTNENAPLLLLIHGYGADEQDLFSFANDLPKAFYIVSARAPHNLPMGGFAWYAIHLDANQNKFSDLEQARSSLDLLEDLIADLVEKRPIDADNVNLFGFSQGAVLSYALGLNTNKVKNVLAISGYLEEGLINKKPHSHTKFFISHGLADPVIPFQWAERAKIYLDNINVDHRFKSYPVGHTIAPQNFKDIKSWIEQNIKI